VEKRKIGFLVAAIAFAVAGCVMIIAHFTGDRSSSTFLATGGAFIAIAFRKR
jgi:hypothetical protein